MKKEFFLLLLTLFIYSISMGNAENPMLSSEKPAYNQSISATIKNNIVEISWFTTSSNNVRRYEVEKSNDGNHFTYITALPAIKHNSTQKMIVIDKDVEEGSNYYRVKTIYKNGTFHYQSNTAVINNKNIFTPAILPQIAENNLYVWMPANVGINKLVIYDAAGRTVLKQIAINVTTNLADISIDKLPQGAYSAMIVTSNQETVRLKFAKK